MKVCFIVDLPTQTTGGAELQCYLIGKRLAEGGWNIAYITRKHFVRSEPEFRVYLSSARGNNLISRCIGALLLVGQLKHANPDIALATYRGAWSGLAALYCKILKKKFVFRAANILDTDMSLRGRKGIIEEDYFERLLYPFAPRNADVIVTNAQYVAAAFRKSLPDKKILVIPNGQEIKSVHRGKPFHVLWMARMHDQKNPKVFVRLAKELPKVAFVMCGDGPLYDEIACEARRVPNLSLLGRVSEERKSDLLQAAYAVVNPSSFEGFPNTLIEAGIYMTPYVSFVDPDEVICRYKLGFHVKSFHDLVERTAMLVKDEHLRERLGENIRAYVETNHNIEHTISRYKQMFKSLSQTS